MCGIFFSLSRSDHVPPDVAVATLLKKRGPDSSKACQIRISGDACPEAGPPDDVFLTFFSTVLALRGDHIEVQPLIDPASESILCWNGEAWSYDKAPIIGNDGHLILEQLVGASKSTREAGAASADLKQGICKVISQITGPFSFVFLDRPSAKLFYGRDCLGRRSLLRRADGSGNLILTSLCDGSARQDFSEVEAAGITMIDLKQDHRSEELVPWSDTAEAEGIHILPNPIPAINKALPDAEMCNLSRNAVSVSAIDIELRRSLELRIRDIPIPPKVDSSFAPSKLAVLFSGGLDCSVLARLSHDILPESEPIDLLNVAFENPRIAATLKDDAPNAIYEACPDRKTGRATFEELSRICPGRIWRFVEINVPYTDFLGHRTEVLSLMYPHNTEMDLSIAAALYFAARGIGHISSPSAPITRTPYQTSARVLLSGLGADELFGGYIRHATAFTHRGVSGLIDELELDVTRLGKRNLGRDDRVISHWGREARFPYLDESFMSWALKLPVWEKCPFAQAQISKQGEPEIEPGKQVLRLLAHNLGMVNVAVEKKRAIQFGARTAKMEGRKTKGTDALF